MKKYILVINVIVFSVLTSCNKTKNNQINFKVIDSIRLTIPKYFPSGEGVPQTCIYENDSVSNLYLMFMNIAKKENELITFNLKSKNNSKIIILPYEGATDYKQSTILGVKSPDSIFIASFLGHKFSLLNAKGDLLNTFDYKYESNEQSVNEISGDIWNPLYFIENKIYYSVKTSYQNHFNKKLNTSILFEYDLNTNLSSSVNVKIPDDFIKSDYFSSDEIHYTSNGKQFVFSSAYSNNIWVTDIESGRLKIIDITSKDFKSFELRRKDNDSDYEYIVNSRYSSIAYDKYRDVYYIFFYPGMDNIKKGDENNAYLSWNLPIFNIIVLDNKFNKLGEVEMPKDTYVFDNYFISKKGLNLNANHENNKDYDENYMRYHTLKLIR